jgi:hypothetical protein
MGDIALACFGQIPWIDSQGAQQAPQRRVTMSMTTATATTTKDSDSNDNDANDKDDGDGNNDDGEVKQTAMS